MRAALVVAAVLAALFALVAVATAQQQQLLPVVLMHGVNSDTESMEPVVDWIHEELGPNIYVKNVEIGNGKIDSIFMSMTDQVANFCDQMAADPQLAGGFNLLGFSQGTLITRAFIERCNYPPVFNYFSWAGPQDGQFGIPYVGIDWIDELVGATPYARFVQDTFSFAQYWKDPFQYAEYLRECVFLPDINNELEARNATYKSHLTSLNSVTLIYSTVDEVINPPQSGWFSFYNDSMKSTVPLNQTQQYLQDWLGLKTLDDEKRLVLANTNCTHTGHTDDDCKQFFDAHTLPLLSEIPPPKWSAETAARTAKPPPVPPRSPPLSPESAAFKAKMIQRFRATQAV